MKSARRCAFTLVELLVVIAIIGILDRHGVAGGSSLARSGATFARACRTSRGSVPPCKIMNSPTKSIRLERSTSKAPFIRWPAAIIATGSSIFSPTWTKPMLFGTSTRRWRLRSEERARPGLKDSPAGMSERIDSPPDVPASNYAAVHHDVEAPIDSRQSRYLLSQSPTCGATKSPTARRTPCFSEKSLSSLTISGWMSGTRATLRNTGMALNSGLPLVPVPTSAQDIPEESPKATADATAINASSEREAAVGVAAVPATAVQPNPAAAAAPADPTLFVGGFLSRHTGGVNFAFGDGSVRFVPDTISLDVLQRLANRADGKLMPADGF